MFQTKVSNSKHNNIIILTLLTTRKTIIISYGLEVSNSKATSNSNIDVINNKNKQNNVMFTQISNRTHIMVILILLTIRKTKIILLKSFFFVKRVILILLAMRNNSNNITFTK